MDLNKICKRGFYGCNNKSFCLYEDFENAMPVDFKDSHLFTVAGGELLKFLQAKRKHEKKYSPG